MRLLINANVFGWKMTGLMPKGAGWFFGFSRRPKEIDMEKPADGAMSARTAGLERGKVGDMGNAEITGG